MGKLFLSVFVASTLLVAFAPNGLISLIGLGINFLNILAMGYYLYGVEENVRR